MIRIRPFKAVRPARDKAPLVATRSYVSYSEEELRDKLENNPYTFLHIIHPRGTEELEAKEKYPRVRKAYEEFLGDGIFARDKKACYYLYRQEKSGRQYTGIIAANAVEDYLSGKIKKHEHTITERERMFKDYLKVTGFNAEPVLLMHPPRQSLKEVFAKYTRQRAEYEFTSTDRVTHKLWLIDEEEDQKTITAAFGEMDGLYIADGHHRCASSALLAQELNAEGGSREGKHNYFMSLLIGEDELHISEFNRLIKETGSYSGEEFLDALEECFGITKASKPVKPQVKHTLGMYLHGQWYELKMKNPPREGNAVEKLDAYLLTKHILTPLLGIEDLRTDHRIQFLPGILGPETLRERVDKGDFELGFTLYPAEIKDLKSVSDTGLYMPPKSTYVEPKLRSGLVVYSME